MSRYFFGENAGRPIRVGRKQYAFEILSIAGGTQQGVVAVPDEECAAFLAVAAKWVTEISPEAYTEAIEKKKNDRRSQYLPDLTPPPRPGPPLKGRGAVEVEGGTQPKKEIEQLPEKIDDAVDLGRGDVPREEVTEKPTTRRLNHRQKRGTD
jgi:hypothetical protein